MSIYGTERTHPDLINILTDETAALRRENAELRRLLAAVEGAERLQALLRSRDAHLTKYPAALHQVQP